MILLWHQRNATSCLLAEVSQMFGISRMRKSFFIKATERLKLTSTILAYYRHERIVEDIAVYGQELLLTTAGGEDRLEMYKQFIGMFEPRGVVDIAFETDEGLSL